MIDEEAIFIDGTKIEANANKFSFVWRRSVEKYSADLVEKSNRFYEELLEKEIIPEIERESPGEITTDELTKVVETLEEKVKEYDRKIEASKDVSERKKLRSERKAPKHYRKQFTDFVARKQSINKTWKFSENGIVTRRRTMTPLLCG